MEESKKIKLHNNKKPLILSYSDEDDFEQYIFRVIAAYRIGFKNEYSELIFGIDPGIKHIGLIIFLDGYYLKSQTFFERDRVIKSITNYAEYLQNRDKKLIKLHLKFGRGDISTTVELVEKLFKNFENRDKLKVSIIDEAFTSKIKVHYNNKKFPKHEASALILALREGIEVNQNNYMKTIKQFKSSNLNKRNLKMENKAKIYETMETLSELAERILKGEVSISSSLQILNEIELNNN